MPCRLCESWQIVSLSNLSDSLYDKIRTNKGQHDEWVELYAVNKIPGYSFPFTKDFLYKNNGMILDTKYFDPSFKEVFLTELTNVDDNIDGLLINSDNYQAINFLEGRYKYRFRFEDCGYCPRRSTVAIRSCYS